MTVILGIDEVGVGAIAGPAFVGLVAFDEIVPSGLRDSKKLSKTAREKFDKIIRNRAVVCEVEIVPLDDINNFNIRGAVNRAIERAFGRIRIVPDKILMDGIVAPDIPNVRCVKGGDDLIPAISAASIAAKVARDCFMLELSKQFNMYGWETNVGYPTKKHLEAIKIYGISCWHRLYYSCVRDFVGIM